MICGTHSLFVANDCLECSKDSLSDKETCLSIASSEDVATDCFTDDDEEVPRMLTLERDTTLTIYNEISSHEWQASAFAVPCFQSADYMQPPPPPPVVPPCTDLLPPSPPVWEPVWKFTVPCDVENQFAALRGQVARLAFHQSGCRIVQQAIQAAGTDEVGEILTELHGHVYAASRSPYANYVIQKLIEAVPPSLSSFVAYELCGVAGVVARNKYGCRILCRVFEHSAAEPWSRTLADELLRETVALSRHTFAHHVMEVILAHGSLEQRQNIVEALSADFWANAHDQNSSYVLESAMIHCAEQELERLVEVISAGSSERVVSLLQGKAGNRVLKSLPKMPAQLSQHVLQTVVGKLQASESMYADNRYGKRLVQELKMHAKAAIAA